MKIDLGEAAKQLPPDVLHQLYKHVYAYHIAEQKPNGRPTDQPELLTKNTVY